MKKDNHTQSIPSIVQSCRYGGTVGRNAQPLDRLETCMVCGTILRENVPTRSRLHQSIMKSVVAHGTTERFKFI